MAELFNKEEEWIEISDDQGHKASLLHLAMVRDGTKIYHVLGAFTPQEDGECESGLLLVREDSTADGMQEYVIASDDEEIERVMGSFVMQAMAYYAASESQEEDDELCACGSRHAPGEFCVCDDPKLLQ